MSDAILDPCPRCGATVEIYPQAGGTKTSGLTCYMVECSNCDLTEREFGQNSGRKRDAIREWNRFVATEKKSSGDQEKP